MAVSLLLTFADEMKLFTNTRSFELLASTLVSCLSCFKISISPRGASALFIREQQSTAITTPCRFVARFEWLGSHSGQRGRLIIAATFMYDE